MHPILCTNTHHDVTDLAYSEIVENIKIWISQERNITFPQNKKLSTCTWEVKVCRGGYL